MPSQPATKQDIKELLTDFGVTHAKQFQRIDERFDRVDKKLTEHDAQFKRIDERFDKVDERFDDIAQGIKILDEATTGTFRLIDTKLDHLLTDTRYDQLERRLTQVEHALYGDRRS